MIGDLCLNRMSHSYKLKIKDKNKKFIEVDYINDHIDKINISSSLHSPNINNLFPMKDKYYSKPFISCKYSSKISSTFTNYQTVVNNVNTNYQSRNINTEQRFACSKATQC